jgi:hypothetical protein
LSVAAPIGLAYRVTILALNLLIDLTYSLVDSRIMCVSSRMAEVPERRFA